jgi:acyl carrier protein
MAQNNSESIRDTLSTLVKQELGLEGPLPDGDLSEHLDSIQRLTFVVAIEDHFEIAFDIEDDEQAKTIEDVIKIIEKRAFNERYPST